jgi:hypothetical protein
MEGEVAANLPMGDMLLLARSVNLMLVPHLGVGTPSMGASGMG